MDRTTKFPKFLNIVLVILTVGIAAITPELQTKICTATDPTVFSTNNTGGTRTVAVNNVTDQIYIQDSPATRQLWEVLSGLGVTITMVN